MDPIKYFRDEVLYTIEQAVYSDETSETKEAYYRLIFEGIGDVDAKIMIGQCLLVEIFGTFMNNEPFQEERYLRNLRNLPTEPPEIIPFLYCN